ncbi:MAG: ABC transporter permease [Verrucomicrobia subdivision 3 bacterium]|nr:ABC transporter permease [Limisphaerales bacterium]
MTFLPIVERELRVRARHPATFRIRIGAAILASLIAGFFLLTSRGWSTPGKIGKTMFWVLSSLAFFWCLLEGPRNTSDALSEEKRAGTLGLLFLTDLKPYDVVFGKFVANSLNSLYGVLAILPILSFPLLLGGVTPGEFWRMVLTLLAALLFSLGAGILISAASRDERRAWFATVGVIGFLVVIPPLFRWLPGSTQLLAWCSPAVAAISLGDAAFSARPQPYWTSISGTMLVTFGFFIAACLVLPNSWHDIPVQRANREVGARNRLRREVARRRSMHQNPVVWLLARDRQNSWPVWLVVSVIVPALIASILMKGASFLAIPFIIGAVVVHLLLAVFVAAQACFMIADTRSSGALDLLLTTPINSEQIIAGYLEALRRQFMGPLCTLAFLEYLVVLNFGGFNASGDIDLLLIFLLLLALGIFAMDLLAVAWFGVWAGLTTKRPAHAVMKTIAYVLILPMLFAWCLWPVMAIVKDAIFINYARNQLRLHFRSIVTEGIKSAALKSQRPLSWPPKLPNVLEK